METLLALLQAEGAKIEEDTEVRLDTLSGLPPHVWTLRSPCPGLGLQDMGASQLHSQPAALPIHEGRDASGHLGLWLGNMLGRDQRWPACGCSCCSELMLASWVLLSEASALGSEAAGRCFHTRLAEYMAGAL